LREGFERAELKGDPPLDFHPADLARFVIAPIQGIPVQAAGGALNSF
jgi:hypothetical protein